jgi:hypothetical protein
MHGPGIERRWGEEFSALQIGPGPIQSPVYFVPDLFPGALAAETWFWPATRPSAKVKERVEIYLYCPSRPYIIYTYRIWNSTILQFGGCFGLG